MKLIIDIETRHNASLVNTTQYPGQGLSDAEALRTFQQQLKDKSGSDFLPVLYHVPITIGFALLGQDNAIDVLSNCGDGVHVSGPDHEATIVHQFWNHVNFSGALITWNGRGFDLPVLELHAMKYGIPAKDYWRDGSDYRYRFKSIKHDDLSDYLSGYGATSRMSLDGILKFLGYAGKGDIDGSQVQAMWEAGRHEEIAAYCRRDVLQTWVIYLHVEQLRGRLTESRFQELLAQEDDRLREIR